MASSGFWAPMACSGRWRRHPSQSRSRPRATRRLDLRWAALLGLAPLLGGVGAARAADVMAPVRIPLRTLAYPTSGKPTFYKYGLYVSLGGATTPQLFEFDTGGEGFHAAYSASAPWWGSSFTDTGVSFDKKFDSGEAYKGKVVKTGFALFGLPGQSSAPLFATTGSDYKVGAADDIKDKGSPVWPNAGNSPPVQNYFYGDFGLTLKKGADDIDNLFAQLTYGGSASPGYSVALGPYGSLGGSSLQLGLSSADLSNPGTRWFAMVGADPSKPFAHSGLPSFSAELLQATLNLSKPGITPLQLSALGLNLDTGTPGVTLHYNLDQDGSSLAPFRELDASHDPIALLPGVDLNLSALDTSNQPQTLLNLLTGNTYGLNKVYAFPRGDKKATYLNSEIGRAHV